MLALSVGGVLYSVKPFRLKERPLLDVFMNAFGAGFVSFIAGWSVFRPLSEMVQNLVPLLSSLWLSFLIGSKYLVTVVMDHESDKECGVTTTSVVFGKKFSLGFSFVLNVLSQLILISLCVLERRVEYFMMLPFAVKGPLDHLELVKNHESNRIFDRVKKDVAYSFLVFVLILTVYSVKMIG